MTQSQTAIALPATPRPAVLPALVEVTKPGITRLVTITAVVGFVLEALAESISIRTLLVPFAACVCGTALAAAGANALNQWLEGGPDAKMRRTSGRPLPSGRLPAATIAWFGTVIGLAGVFLLCIFANAAAGLVALTCLLSYVFIYTPLKKRTAWNTLVGTIPGALPPMIGVAAASGAPGAEVLVRPIGLSLFALMTVWQIPHFLAIAVLYKDDYAEGGFRMLPNIDASGRWTASVIAATAVLLVPVTLTPTLAAPELLGLPYLALAMLSGIGFAVLSVRFALFGGKKNARRVFLASIAHLPLLLVAMIAEAGIRSVM